MDKEQALFRENSAQNLAGVSWGNSAQNLTGVSRGNSAQNLTGVSRGNTVQNLTGISWGNSVQKQTSNSQKINNHSPDESVIPVRVRRKR
ncbi:TPA: hypothetical protein SMP48_002912 [Proteus mirabilis]|nr:hypothetical protein [Proteus mirabilis]